VTREVTDRPEFSPLPPDAPTVDRISTAMLSMGSAAAAGVAWFSVLTLAVIRLRPDAAPQTATQVDPSSLYVNVAAYGTMIGVAFIGITAWRMLAPIPSRYRRGALSMVAALGGWCVAMAATFLAHVAAGGPGLIGLAVLSAIVAIWLARRAKASAR
jgi:hypothetical protein